MFKEQYQRLNEQVNPDVNLIQAIVNEAEKQEEIYTIKSFSLKKPIVAIVAVCLCLSLAMPALAANVEPIYKLMYMVSPSIAQYFIPIQKSDEDNGIKMELVSAYIHDDVAEIYITMQDQTEDRIDETTDLFDSYSINRPFDCSAHCERVGYDENTKTATFLITIAEWGDREIAGDKITFTVGEFLSHKKHYNDISVPIDLSNVSDSVKTQIVSSSGGGGAIGQYDRNPTAIIPGDPSSAFSVEGIDLTGIGYIDGKLHIQTELKNRLDNDNHGFFYLKDINGNIVEQYSNFYFYSEDTQDGRLDYCEYVFDVSEDEIGNYTLHGDFVTGAIKTEGNWKVTFPLENRNNQGL